MSTYTLQKNSFITRPVDLFYIEQVLNDVLQFLEYSLNKKHRILDYGCGFGEKLRSFGLLGMEAVGIDIDLLKIKKAKEMYPSCFLASADILHLPFNNHSFDVVFSSSTLQYVEKERALSEIFRILRPGGKVIFLENLSNNPIAKGYRFFHKILRIPYFKNMTPQKHLNSDCSDLFKSYFINVEVKYYNLLTPLAIIIPTIHKYIVNSNMLLLRPHFSYKTLSIIDSILLRFFPFLNVFCWTFYVKAESKNQIRNIKK